MQDLGRPFHAFGDFLPGRVAHRKTEAYVLGDREVRIESIVLEDHGDVPVARVELDDALSADRHLSGIGIFEAG